MSSDYGRSRFPRWPPAYVRFPAIEPGADEDWDCSSIHDPFPLIYNGRIYLYYKGSPGQRRGGENIIRAQGVAIATKSGDQLRA